MVVARASRMDLASSLKRNTFLTLGVRSRAGLRCNLNFQCQRDIRALREIQINFDVEGILAPCGKASTSTSVVYGVGTLVETLKLSLHPNANPLI